VAPGSSHTWMARRCQRAMGGATVRMIGKFFHSFENGEVDQQGVIVGRPTPGVFLVQFHEWLTGGPGKKILVPIADMAGWHFYDSAAEMQRTYEQLTREAIGLIDEFKKENPAAENVTVISWECCSAK
jgi:hypothetical protein